MLRLEDDVAHRPQNQILGSSCIEQHCLEDVAVEHALGRYVIGGGVDAGNTPDCLDQRIAMPTASAPDEGAINIKEDKSGRGRVVHI